MTDEQIIARHRTEGENIVISLINSGWGRSEAEYEARERILNRYAESESNEN